MEKEFRLPLLDANFVIELFRQGIWEDLIARCDVHLSKTVAQVEAQFYEDDWGEAHYFDLEPYIESACVTVFDVTASELSSFRKRFGPSYIEKLDPGETESLIYLQKQDVECRICSADKIVFRVLGNLRLTGEGISLQEVLRYVGLDRDLRPEFCKEYREKWSRRGFGEGMRGIGLQSRE